MNTDKRIFAITCSVSIFFFFLVIDGDVWYNG